MKTIRVSKIKSPSYRRRIVCFVLSVTVLTIVLMSLFAATALASTSGVVTLPVQQIFTFTGSAPRDIFTYELTPAATTNPMPTGGGMFTITG